MKATDKIQNPPPSIQGVSVVLENVTELALVDQVVLELTEIHLLLPLLRLKVCTTTAWLKVTLKICQASRFRDSFQISQAETRKPCLGKGFFHLCKTQRCLDVVNISFKQQDFPITTSVFNVFCNRILLSWYDIRNKEQLQYPVFYVVFRAMLMNNLSVDILHLLMGYLLDTFGF